MFKTLVLQLPVYLASASLVKGMSYKYGKLSNSSNAPSPAQLGTAQGKRAFVNKKLAGKLGNLNKRNVLASKYCYQFDPRGRKDHIKGGVVNLDAKYVPVILSKTTTYIEKTRFVQQ